METIFCDFDGVLFDSVKEAYLLSRYVCNGISPNEKICETEFNSFSSLRYLISDSWQYYYLFKVIKSDTEQNPEKIYHQYIKQRKITEDKEFDKNFQKKRKDLIKNEYKFWNSLEIPYTFFEEIKKIKDRINFLILSTKNEEAIIRHCNDYGFIISKERVIGKNKLKKFGSKRIFMEYYINTYKINNAIFIDDNINTIEDCKNIPEIKAYLAGWGYCSPTQKGYNCEEIIKKIKEII